MKKKILVTALGICLLLTVLFLSLPAGGREGQEVASTATVQENENSLPADLKQMVAFKTSAGGDLKIYLMGDDSVLVSVVEPVDPERAEALSRMDLSDVTAVYQTLTGNSEVPEDLVRMHDIITANRERRPLHSPADRQEYRSNLSLQNELGSDFAGYSIASGPLCPYTDNKYTKDTFTKYFDVFLEGFGYPAWFLVNNLPNEFFQAHLLPKDEGNPYLNNIRSNIYVNRVCNLDAYVIHRLDRRVDAGYWKPITIQNIKLGYMGLISYNACPYVLRLTADPLNSAYYYLSVHSNVRSNGWNYPAPK